MKVLFPFFWIAGHSGDNANWKKLVGLIEYKFPNTEFMIGTQYSPEAKAIMKWDIAQLKEVAKNIQIIPRSFVKHFDYSKFRVLTTEKQVINYMCSVEPTEYLKEVDLVISQGGGYMFSEGCFKDYLPQVYIAQELGKPTFFNTQTFIAKGLTQATKYLGHIVFERAKILIAREPASADSLKTAFKLPKLPKISPDFTFDTLPRPYPHPLPKDAIKINVRGYSANQKSIQLVAKVADMIIETLGPIVFVPVSHGGDRDDRIVHHKIINLMRHESILIEDKIDSGQVMSIVKDGIFITDRYHGAIFSAAMCTPFVPLMPDIGFKMQGLLDRLKYPHTKVMRLQSMEAQELYEYIVKVWKQRQAIRQNLEQIVPSVKNEVIEATRLLEETITNACKE